MAKKQKKISEMNVKELQDFIRKKSKKANTILKRIYKQKEVTKAVAEELKILARKDYISKRGKIKYGFRNKSKEELVRQARELDYFTDWKGTETEAVMSATDKKRYDDFIQNEEFKNYTFQQWRDFVETMGTMESKVQSFGYENLKQEHIEKTDKNIETDFANTITEVYKNKKGSYITQEDLMDALREVLIK